MTVDFKKAYRVSRVSLFFALFITVFLFIVLWKHIVITIPAGHVGVMWWRFFGGTELNEKPRGEGIQLIFPWDKIFIYNARVQAASTTYNVVANNGLSFFVAISIRWSIRHSTVARLHKEIGPDYFQTLVIPNVGSIVREAISRYPAEDVYANKRYDIQNIIYDDITHKDRANNLGRRFGEELETEFVHLEDILITDVTLPDPLRLAIDRKFSEAEFVKEYQFRVEREVLESKRKQIEAEGIKKFQETVTPTLNDSYLRWTGIQATVKLADSPNTKFVIMGNGPGGLPVILNGFEGDKPTSPPTTEK